MLIDAVERLVIFECSLKNIRIVFNNLMKIINTPIIKWPIKLINKNFEEILLFFRIDSNFLNFKQLFLIIYFNYISSSNSSIN